MWPPQLLSCARRARHRRWLGAAWALATLLFAAPPAVGAPPVRYPLDALRWDAPRVFTGSYGNKQLIHTDNTVANLTLRLTGNDTFSRYNVRHRYLAELHFNSIYAFSYSPSHSWIIGSNLCDDCVPRFIHYDLTLRADLAIDWRQDPDSERWYLVDATSANRRWVSASGSCLLSPEGLESYLESYTPVRLELFNGDTQPGWRRPEGTDFLDPTTTGTPVLVLYIAPINPPVDHDCLDARYGDNAHYQRDGIPRTAYGPWFDLGDGGSAMVIPTGTVSGEVSASQPVVTADGVAVQNGKAYLIRQRGAIRARGDGESDEAYQGYLEEMLEGAQPEVFLEQGRFRIGDVPLFHFVERAGRQVMTQALYTLRIDDAQSEELSLEGGEETTTLHFTRGERHDIRAGDAVRLTLSPLDGIATKRALALEIARIAPVNYAAAENLAIAYVNRLADDPALRTDAALEGLKRAIWAERLVRDGARNADQLIEAMLGGLAAGLTNLLEEFNGSYGARKALAKQRDRVENLRENLHGRLLEERGWHTLGGLTPEAGELRNRIIKLVNENQWLLLSELFKVIKAGLKVTFTSIRQGLILGGVDPSPVDTVQLLLFLAIDGLIQQGAGSLEAPAKWLVEGVINGLHDDLYDGVSPISYTALTLDTLSGANGRMERWERFDRGLYRYDRGRLVSQLNRMNATATGVLQAATYAGFANEAADLGETVFDVAGTVLPVGKKVAMAFKLAKYVSNAVNFQAPAVTMLSLPSRVEAGVETILPAETTDRRPDAARRAPSLPLFDQRRAVERRSGEIGPALAAFEAAVAAVEGALAEDRILDAAMLSSNPADERDPATLLGAYHGLTRLSDRLSALTAASRLTAADSTTALQGLVINDAELRSRLLTTAAELATLYLDVIELRYPDNTDPAYLLERNRLGNRLAEVVRTARALAFSLQAVSELIAGADGRPALLIESPTVVSDDTGLSFATGHDEAFTLQAEIHNLGATTVEGATARLTVPINGELVALDSPAELTLPPLTADDGLESGGSRQRVGWRLRYRGEPPESRRAVLVVELLEAGAAPSGFSGDRAVIPLALSPALSDADRDGMDDGLERRYGLDPTLDDGAGDLDRDGLLNGAEFDLFTRPDLADSDGDGLSDGEEATPGADGLITDPLNPEDEAASSGEEPTADEPRVLLSSRVVRLTPEQPNATITVTNGGGGSLTWGAVAEHPARVDAVPSAPALAGEGSPLTLSLPSGYDFSRQPGLVTRIRVFDAAGAVRDEQLLTVFVGEVGEAGIAPVELRLNQRHFRAGDQLVLSVRDVEGVADGAFDVYLGLLLPDGGLLLRRPDGLFGTDLVPLISGATAARFDTELLRYPLTGSEPPGEYRWLVAFTRPGTLQLIGELAESPFSVAP